MALNGNTDITSLIENYTPAYKNRYTVTFAADDSNGDNLNTLASFGATRVSFGDESLTFVRNSATKHFTLKEDSYKRSDTLSITWRESDMYLLKKLHADWLALFYDKDTDKFISATSEAERNARYRTITVDVPSAKSSQYKRFVFRCLPSNIGNLDLAWGSTSSITEYTLNYFVDSWHMEDVAGSGEPQI